MSKRALSYVLESDVAEILAGRCLTAGQRKNGDAMARLLRRAIGGGLDEDWFEEAADEVSYWEAHMADEDLRAAKAVPYQPKGAPHA